MKIVLAGITAAIALGVILGAMLPSVREPAYRAFATSSVRVGDPGHNLVGQDWNPKKLSHQFQAEPEK